MWIVLALYDCPSPRTENSRRHVTNRNAFRPGGVRDFIRLHCSIGFRSDGCGFGHYDCNCTLGEEYLTFDPEAIRRMSYFDRSVHNAALQVDSSAGAMRPHPGSSAPAVPPFSPGQGRRCHRLFTLVPPLSLRRPSVVPPSGIGGITEGQRRDQREQTAVQA
jgi:hypothetical protein